MERQEQWLRQELEHLKITEANALNGRLRPALHSWDERSVTLEFPLEDWQANGLGTLHGGILAAMLDLTMSLCIYSFSRQSIPPTITMTTNYLRPVPLPGTLLVKATRTSLGRKNATAYSEAILPASGKLAATALGTYAVAGK
jgi:uncharacterized protein (TIGR00369 family)